MKIVCLTWKKKKNAPRTQDIWPILGGFGAVGRIGDDGMKREKPSAAIDGGEEDKWLPGSNVREATFEEDECGRRGCENAGLLPARTLFILLFYTLHNRFIFILSHQVQAGDSTIQRGFK